MLLVVVVGLTQMQLLEVDHKLTETEGELDITMTALLANNSSSADDRQTRALKRVRGNLSQGVYRQLDNLRGNDNQSSPEEEERRKHLVMVGNPAVTTQCCCNPSYSTMPVSKVYYE